MALYDTDAAFGRCSRMWRKLGGLLERHAYGDERKWWGAEVGADPLDLSAALYAAYQAGEDGSAVLRRFSPSDHPQR